MMVEEMVAAAALAVETLKAEVAAALVDILVMVVREELLLVLLLQDLAEAAAADMLDLFKVMVAAVLGFTAKDQTVLLPLLDWAVVADLVVVMEYHQEMFCPQQPQ
jgi:hypothetical protein